MKLAAYPPHQVRQAEETDLIKALANNGYRVSPDGDDPAIPARPGIRPAGNRWSDLFSGRSGNTLDFFKEVLGYGEPDAVARILLERRKPDLSALPVPAGSPGTPLILPPRAEGGASVFDLLGPKKLGYWSLSGPDRKGLVYVTDSVPARGDGTPNPVSIVFVGALDGIYPRSAVLFDPSSGDWTDVPGSDFRFGFQPFDLPDAVNVSVLEDPLDLLALLEIWHYLPTQIKENYLSLNGHGPDALYAYLRSHPQTKTISIFANPRQPGKAERIRASLPPCYKIRVMESTDGASVSEIRTKKAEWQDRKNEPHIPLFREVPSGASG